MQLFFAIPSKIETLELQFYCRHIVSELEMFYKDEYEALEMLARGETADFIGIGQEPQWVMHLKGYGIVSIDHRGRPSVQLPVLQRYIAATSARKRGSRELRAIIPPAKRGTWLEMRKSSILRDLKTLLKAVSDKAVLQPYKEKFIPEADRFASVALATDWPSFSHFINNSFQTFCETMDKIHNTNVFYTKFRQDFPDLFHALNRIRVFRNDVDHIILNEKVQTVFDKYIEEDLLGRTLSQVQEPWFVLQQVVLDEVFVALQYELSQYT